MRGGEREILGMFAAGVVAVGAVYFVADHPQLMGEWVVWAAWQMRLYLLTIAVLLTLALLVRRRRQRRAIDAAAKLTAALGSRGVAAGPQVTETTEPPVQRVEHTHIHLDGGRTPHPYSCPCRGKAEIACEETGDHNTHAACTNGRRPCPFPTDIQMEV